MLEQSAGVEMIGFRGQANVGKDGNLPTGIGSVHGLEAKEFLALICEERPLSMSALEQCNLRLLQQQHPTVGPPKCIHT